MMIVHVSRFLLLIDLIRNDHQHPGTFFLLMTLSFPLGILLPMQPKGHLHLA